MDEARQLLRQIQGLMTLGYLSTAYISMTLALRYTRQRRHWEIRLGRRQTLRRALQGALKGLLLKGGGSMDRIRINHKEYAGAGEGEMKGMLEIDLRGPRMEVEVVRAAVMQALGSLATRYATDKPGQDKKNA